MQVKTYFYFENAFAITSTNQQLETPGTAATLCSE
jgi:hypothetical protein